MPDETPSISVNRELTTEIVAAYVRRNQVAFDQLATLISTVYQALASLGKQVAEVSSERTPAVPIRRSVHRDYVVCLECGWRGQMARRHLTTGHGLSVDQYRARWNLPRDHPMVAPGYSERRSSLAKQIGLGRGRRTSREEPGPVAPDEPPAAQPQPRRRGRPRSTTTATLAKPAPIPNTNCSRHPERVLEDRLYQYGRYIGVERISRTRGITVAPNGSLRAIRRYAAPCCALYAPRKSA
jgi:predicted transcriptional regulator